MLNFSVTDAGAPSALRRLLFRDSLALTRSEVIRWWERRRLAYNIAVGGTGLLTIVVITTLTRLGPATHPWPFPSLIAILAYGAFANVMYTSGWIIELASRPVFGVRTGTVGATLFRYGLAFSVGMTMLPMGAATAELAARLVQWVAR